MWSPLLRVPASIEQSELRGVSPNCSYARRWPGLKHSVRRSQSFLHVPRDWVNHVVAPIAVGTPAVERLRGPEEFDYGKREGRTLTPTATASGLGRRCGGTLTDSCGDP
jgi:hypothetical protein